MNDARPPRCSMRTSNPSRALALAIILAGCVRLSSPHPAPLENDGSIIFPQFFARSAQKVGSGDVPYELDGVVLRAIMIAANDYRPQGDKDLPCWDRQEAYQYRVIRQGNIIFVDISEDIDFCGLKYVSVDSGAKYAISTDGRILRRIMGAEPEEPSRPATPDAGDPGATEAPAPEAPASSLTRSAPENMPPRISPSEQQDGGVGPVSDGGS